MSRISARKISVRTQEGNVLLFETSFDVLSQSVLGIYGPNGSGKTSLLKSIAGYKDVKSVSGEFWIGSELISENFSPEKNISQVLYLGSDFQTPFEISVQELFEMGSLVHSSTVWPKLRGSEVQKISEIASALQLNGFLKRTFNSLSDGEKQLVMFARCLIQNPKLLILDETFSKLDLDKLILVSQVMKQRLTHGITFFVASHDLNFLSEISDQLLILKEGEMLANGPVFEVFCLNHLQDLYPNLVLQVVKSPETGKPKLLY